MNMIPIYSLLATTTALNVSLIARKKQLAAQNRKLNELLIMQRIHEKNAILGDLYGLAHSELKNLIDPSKSVDEDSDVEFNGQEFDKNGNLLIRRSGFKSLADQEKVIELYSPETGEMFFSYRQYTSVNGDCDRYEHYSNGACDTEEFLENISKMKKKAQLEAKREAYREKAKSKMLKFKKFLGFGR